MQRVRSSTGESEGPSRAAQRPEPIRPGREASAEAIAVEPSQAGLFDGVPAERA